MYKNRENLKNPSVKFKIMLQNSRSTQVNNISIQIIYKSIRSEEYESNSAPGSANLRLLIARSIKISTKYLKYFEILERYWPKNTLQKNDYC